MHKKKTFKHEENMLNLKEMFKKKNKERAARDSARLNTSTEIDVWSGQKQKLNT